MNKGSAAGPGDRLLPGALSRWEWEGGSLAPEPERYTRPTSADLAGAGARQDGVENVSNRPGAAGRRGGTG